MVPANALCFFRDGDQWCCVWGDFVNLQESNAGFGATREIASLDLRSREPRDQPVGEMVRGLTPTNVIEREVRETVERTKSSYSSTDLGSRAGLELGVFDDEA